MAKPDKFIVVYEDDGGSAMCLFRADPSYDGALQAVGRNEPTLLFESKAAAQKAIRISEVRDELLALQGKPYNLAFTRKYIKNVRILPCKFAT